ncbi:fatty acid hydroxylase domain-containing protein 2-like [Argopecten irradians]|uniref:fatty acid hydroxylase domain-containing protein 2-like n=1 Tax=Argopecten irradians TaxID=31199 RepID=UPI003714C5C1
MAETSSLVDFLKSEWFQNTAILSSVLVVAYFGTGFLFLIPDLTGKPKWMLKFKTQSPENYKVTVNDVGKVLRQLTINSLLIHLPFMFVYYYLQVWRGCDQTLGLPALLPFIRDLSLCILLEEVTFYYSHRILHSPFMYKRYHKLHHDFTAPFGLVSAYSHPVEFMFSNLGTIMTGPLVIGCDVVTSGVWLFLSVVVTVIHHSGYHLPLLPSPEFHDYHHLKFTGNYGVLGILDWLHGTDKHFRKSKQSRRHKLIFSARELIG